MIPTLLNRDSVRQPEPSLCRRLQHAGQSQTFDSCRTGIIPGTTSDSSRLNGDTQSKSFWIRLLLPVLFCLAGFEWADAQDPGLSLRQVVDAHFDGDFIQPQRASDAQFARRVSLDLTGMPLSVSELTSFLEDSTADKRERLVEKLMNSPQFERHFASFLDVTLMERRQYKDIKEEQWKAYLLSSVRVNKPWNVLAKEILSADGVNDGLRPAVRFALSRDAEPNLLTRDIGRIFFGRDLQCAQCHDHPLVDDYLQSDYQGLLAFVAPGYIKTIQKPGPKTKDGKPGKPVNVKVYAERDGNDINFESVFFKETKHRTSPRLIGQVSITEPDRLDISPAIDVRPQHSRRERMARKATDGSNIAFNENMANRLWGLMFGRGLVDPPDFHHRDNPPMKPDLLKQLGAKFAESGFDMRAFLKQLALSKAYQNSYEIPSMASSIDSIQLRLENKESEVNRLKLEIKKVMDLFGQRSEEWNTIETRLLPIAMEIDKLKLNRQKQIADKTKVQKELEKVSADLNNQSHARKSVVDLIASLESVSKSLGDSEVDSLLKNANSKRQKLDSVIASNDKKKLGSQGKLKTFEKSLSDSKSAVTASFEKRKPIQKSYQSVELEFRKLRSRVDELVKKRLAIESEIGTLEKLKELSLLRQKRSQLNDKGNDKPVELQVQSERLEDTLANKLSKAHVISNLRPLTPEQLCWSTLRATGVYSLHWNIEESKWRKQKGKKAAAEEEELSSDQKREVEEIVYRKLKSHEQNFIRYYAAGAGQPQGDFFATADQALFAANSGLINSYVAPSGDNLAARLLKINDTKALAEELYLSILSRKPDSSELAVVQQMLPSENGKRVQVIRELIWGLINSAEFRFNH